MALCYTPLVATLKFDIETITVKAPLGTFDILTAQSLKLSKVALIRNWGAQLQSLDGREKTADLDAMSEQLAKTLIVDIDERKKEAFCELGVGQMKRLIDAVFQSMTPPEEAQPG